MPDTADALRHFNRFYTRHIGLLEHSYLDSGMSLTQVRILFEIHEGTGTAREIAHVLGLDEGYLSRVISRFSKQGLITRQRSTRDARRSDLKMTKAGAGQVAALIERSRSAINAHIAPLKGAGRGRLVAATQTIQQCLSDPDAANSAAQPAVQFRDLQIGDVGLITSRHGVLYAKEHGFDESFELTVAEILLDFQRNRRPNVERAWIACRDQQILGSIFCTHLNDQDAKLRLFYLEPEARGLGVGRQMLQLCLSFARDAGYQRLRLWTHESHLAACALYRAMGFTLVNAHSVQNYGQELVEQEWQTELSQK